MPPQERTTFRAHGPDLELSAIPLLQRPELASIGVGVAQLGDESDPRLGVVLAAEGGPKQRPRGE